MKKSNKPDDLLSVTENLIKFMKQNGMTVSENFHVSKLSVGDDEGFSIFKQCDAWCKDILLNHPKKKLWDKQEYPFKNYTHIDALLRKNAVKFVQEIFDMCPIHNKRIYHLYDAIALVIYNHKLDPWSFCDTQNPISLWDKISEDGQV